MEVSLTTPFFSISATEAGLFKAGVLALRVLNATLAVSLLVLRKVRGFQAGSNLLHRHTMKTLGLLLGILFVRSAERGERIYYAMISRGYRGEIACCGHCTPKLRDWLTSLSIMLFGLALKLAEWRGMEQWL